MRGPGGYAALLVPDFPLHALRRIEPDLAGKPLALVAGEGRRSVVIAACGQAAGQGVAAGLPATLAMARCPGLLLRPRDPAAETEAQGLVLAAAFTLSPRVELTRPGCCTADLDGDDPARTRTAMGRAVLELGRSGLPLRIGRASTPFTALCAAASADPILEVGEDGAFLSPMPLDCAGPTAGQAAILAGWGTRTLGDLAALPKAGIVDRLGQAGAVLWDKASGLHGRLLDPAEPARSFAAAWEHEPPVESADPLLFRLRRFAERLALELRALGLAAEALTLTLVLEDGTERRRGFRLPEPGTDVDVWMRVLHTHLDSLRTPARVSAGRLAAAPARPPCRQEGLFETGLRDPALFWENLARLEALAGEGCVGTPVAEDSHRPDAFVLRRPAAVVPPASPPAVHPACGLALRRFRPPWPSVVECEGEGEGRGEVRARGATLGRPVRLGGPRLHGKVTAWVGPWRSSGAWWTPRPWSMETWRVELEGGGGLYQIASTPGGWIVEGMLD